jgi:putative phage-type endonuclease
MKKYPPNYLTFEQRTPEWLAARTGSVTASRVADVVSKLKNGKVSASRATYMMELLAEVVTGSAAEHFVSIPMMYGIENEPLARSMYELKRGVEVERIGYVKHASIPRSGASPDGLVGDHGLVEIKVPNTTTHLGYFIEGVVPEEYKPQMMWQMACTGREWCDFVSYDPRIHEDLGLFIIRFERDEKAIGEMECEVEKFIEELNAMAAKLLKNRPAPTAETTAAPGPPKAIIPEWQPVNDSSQPALRGDGF